MTNIHCLINKVKVEGIPSQKDRIIFFINRVDDLSDEVKNKIIGDLNNSFKNLFEISHLSPAS